MSFSFLRLFKQRRVPSSASTVDVSVSKVVAPVPGEVRFPFLCYYFAGTYAFVQTFFWFSIYFLTVSSDMANGLYKIGTGFKQLLKNLGISGQIVIFMLSPTTYRKKISHVESLQI